MFQVPNVAGDNTSRIKYISIYKRMRASLAHSKCYVLVTIIIITEYFN